LIGGMVIAWLNLHGQVAAQEIHFPFSSKLVFVSNFIGNNEIYLAQNNRLTRLTTHSADDWWPVLSPDGKQLVFSSNRNGNFDVFLLTLENGELNRITSSPQDENDPSWSWDGKSIFFVREEQGKWRLFRYELAGKKTVNPFPKADLPALITPFQSPQGDEFVFTAKVFFGWTVARFQPGTGRFVKIGKSGSCRAKYSPDGRMITFVSHEDDGLGDVWIMNRDGSNQKNLTPTRKDSYDYYPCFSPDGKWIVFSSSPKAKGKTGYDLYMLNRSTGEVEPIFLTAGNDAFPFWGN